MIGGPVLKSATVLLAITVITGCKHPTTASADVSGAETAAATLSDPPTANVGMDVEQAYAAIPHRRTVWQPNTSAVPAEDAAYLRAIFGVIDQAIAVRVAGLQNYSYGHFDSADIDGEFDRLITYARGMRVPRRLTTYHQQVLTALGSERQFFAQWRSRDGEVNLAQQLPSDPNVQSASAASRAAYNELMRLYPNEGGSNKDAFFDYHCALDFL